MKQRKTKCTGPLCAGYLALALMASAAEQTLPAPPLSEFADAESTTTVPIPSDEGRHLKLTLAFEPTHSNAVLVAFGRDLNGSETLEPEETEFVVGCDCGSPVVGVAAMGSDPIEGGFGGQTLVRTEWGQTPQKSDVSRAILWSNFRSET